MSLARHSLACHVPPRLMHYCGRASSHVARVVAGSGCSFRCRRTRPGVPGLGLLRPRFLSTVAEAAPRPAPDPPAFYHIPDVNIEAQDQHRQWNSNLSFLIIPKPVFAKERLCRRSAEGIPGAVGEMIIYCDACIDSGQLDRARLALRRIGEYGFKEKAELVALHNRYLRACLQRLQPDDDLEARRIERWFELEILRKQLPLTMRTLACMLKLSLAHMKGLELQSHVQYYMRQAPGQSGYRVLVDDILSKEDVVAITDICPAYRPILETPAFGGPAVPVVDIPDESASNKYPLVQETPQTGLGLAALKETLGYFYSLSDSADISLLPQEEKIEIQRQLEKDVLDVSLLRWRHHYDAMNQEGENLKRHCPPLQARMFEWHFALERRLRQEISMIEASERARPKSQEDFSRCLCGPFLRLLPPSRLAALTLVSTLDNLASCGGDVGIPTTSLVSAIAYDLREEIIRRKNPGQRTPAWQPSGQDTDASSTEDASTDSPDDAPPLVLSEEPTIRTVWSQQLTMKLGAILLGALLETAKVKVIRTNHTTGLAVHEFQPAFSHLIHSNKTHKIGVVVMNHVLTGSLEREAISDHIARFMPMIVQPKRWAGVHEGGFLETSVPLVRFKNGDEEQMMYADAAYQHRNLDLLVEGLDALGKTAWRVNKPILKVIVDIWNTGEAIAGLVPKIIQQDRPPEPPNSDIVAHRAWARKIRTLQNEKMGNHSQRCFTNLQLELARSLRNQEFFLPHNVDFRGRAYPIPIYLNHISSDNTRSVFVFAKGRPLGPSGLKWLKVHAANKFGFDKYSFAEREQWADDRCEQIFEAVLKPLDGTRWWTTAADPLQFLAACFELKNALDSPDPSQFVSHLPVHQDGTCNGLQHYAALGGDELGARQVNLEPGQSPADVYSAVARLVEDQLKTSARDGSPDAKELMGKIVRKVVKQTVMTTVYGVTVHGATDQVERQLKDHWPALYDDDLLKLNRHARLVARLIFRALATMFSGAREIQEWFNEVGWRVCRSISLDQIETAIKASAPVKKRRRQDKAVQPAAAAAVAEDEYAVPSTFTVPEFRNGIVWTAPIRLPVVQPYRRYKTRAVDTVFARMFVKRPSSDDPVDLKKQLQAFPPNFIHSLDGSHMILTAVACVRAGLTFASVHDSFWTHAGDVDQMNTILRDAFVRMHAEPITARLAAEFETRYARSLYLARIDRRSAAGVAITKFRLKTPSPIRDELGAEYRRLRLLASSDPAQVARGCAIVTPTSLFLELETAAAAVHGPDVAGERVGLATNRFLRFDALSARPGLAADAAAAADAATAAAAHHHHHHHHATTVLHDGQSECNPLDDDDNDDDDDEVDEVDEVDEIDDVDDDLDLDLDLGLDEVDEPIDDESGGNDPDPDDPNELFPPKPKPKPKKKKSAPVPMQIWLPLKFPPAPDKGSFDVHRVKDSPYFFS